MCAISLIFCYVFFCAPLCEISLCPDEGDIKGALNFFSLVFYHLYNGLCLIWHKLKWNCNELIRHFLNTIGWVLHSSYSVCRPADLLLIAFSTGPLHPSWSLAASGYNSGVFGSSVLTWSSSRTAALLWRGGLGSPVTWWEHKLLVRLPMPGRSKDRAQSVVPGPPGWRLGMGLTTQHWKDLLLQNLQSLWRRLVIIIMCVWLCD